MRKRTVCPWHIVVLVAAVITAAGAAPALTTVGEGVVIAHVVVALVTVTVMLPEVVAV